MTIYVVRTTNGKTLTGHAEREDAERSREYWQLRLDNSPLARGAKVEIREVKGDCIAQG